MSHPGSSKPQPRTATRTRSRQHPTGSRLRRSHGSSRPTPTASSPVVLRLLDTTPLTSAQEQALWRMSVRERVAAMYGGRLSLAELTAWSGRRPDQVPLIGGELAYLAMREPAWCEPARPAKEQAA